MKLNWVIGDIHGCFDARARRLGPRAPPNRPRIPQPKRHISGHTPLRRVYRDPTLEFAQIDTGAPMGGRLTAWCTALGACLSVQSKVNWRR